LQRRCDGNSAANPAQFQFRRSCSRHTRHEGRHGHHPPTACCGRPRRIGERRLISPALARAGARTRDLAPGSGKTASIGWRGFNLFPIGCPVEQRPILH
jgi:hypothetical protein